MQPVTLYAAFEGPHPLDPQPSATYETLWDSWLSELQLRGYTISGDDLCPVATHGCIEFYELQEIE